MTFNHGVGDARINPPDYGEARCEDCGSLDCDEITWKRQDVCLCRGCTINRMFAAGEFEKDDEAYDKRVDALINHADMMQDDGCERE